MLSVDSPQLAGFAAPALDLPSLDLDGVCPQARAAFHADEDAAEQPGFCLREPLPDHKISITQKGLNIVEPVRLCSFSQFRS